MAAGIGLGAAVGSAGVGFCRPVVDRCAAGASNQGPPGCSFVPPPQSSYSSVRSRAARRTQQPSSWHGEKRFMTVRLPMVVGDVASTDELVEELYSHRRGGAQASVIRFNAMSDPGRRRLTQNLSWKRNTARALSLSSQTTRSSPATEGTTRCATTEDIEAEKELIEEDAMERMDKTLETVKGNFNTVRTGRASPALLDRVEVEYYGTQVILKSIAQVNTPDGSTILVAPFDKSSLAAIEKAIIKSDVGLNPNNDGNVIRLNVPQLTADRRKELLKLVSRLSEDGKVAIRNVRRDAIKAFEKLQKDKKLSEDSVKDSTEEIQNLTDDYVKKIDALFKQKEKELTTV